MDVRIVFNFSLNALSCVALEEYAQLFVFVEGSRGTAHDLARNGLSKKMAPCEADEKQQKE